MEERTYGWFWRTPAFAPWKPLAALGVMFVAFVLASLIQAVPLVIDLVAGRLDVEELQKGHIRMTPLLLAMTGLGLVLLIPGAMLAQKAVLGQPARWLHSVEGRFRWRWLACCLAVMAALWVPWLVLPVLAGEESPAGNPTNVVLYVVITLLVIPFQSAGEEYMFRGVINRAIAAWFPAEKVGLVVGAVFSSALFMLVHGAGDPWLNVFYFGLGLVFCALCWRTGGLEAAIALHAVNNVLSFILAAVTGQMDQSFDRSTGVGSPIMLAPLALGVVAVLVLDRWRRRRGQPIATAPGLAEIAGQPSMPAYAPPARG